ncbi:S1C family serine protease [Actinomadura flavalba]|uniref:S1C family serine protease n=1 Tax=Actinomadura flavalba TaxID=1120938 RepID=UPI0005247EC3|nr:trypsin-like peptidase domain-containing protein [Actinomadura flavalba]
MGTRTQARAATGAVLAAVLAAGCAGGTPITRSSGSPAASPADSGDGGGAAVALQQQYEQVVSRVLPSVVQITTEDAEGSGVVWDDQGHIVTNAHVVAGAERIRVTAASGGTPTRATLTGSFAADDLAVVKVDGVQVRPARFGDSGAAKVGQIVLAMGNPLGLSGSVSNGIVSALNRTVSTRGEGAFPGATIGNAIQTNAAINPGNSGGALVSLSGEVLGIPTAAASDPQAGGTAGGIGFATPSNTVRSIVPQLIEDGRVTDSGRAALGVTVRTIIDPDSSQQAAVGVVEVEDGGPAARAGIRPGDRIIAVNGTPTPGQTALAEILAGLNPGDRARIDIENPTGQRRTTNVTLGELPAGGA